MNFEHPLRLVTPTLDGDVLRVLAAGDKAFTASDVQRLAAAGSRQGIRLVLLRLLDQGIVDVERIGRSFVYRLNREHLAAPHIVALASIRIELVERLRRAFATWDMPPTAAAVFGSVARGQATEESDVDLLIVRPDRIGAEDDVWRAQIAAVERQTARWTGNDARVLEYSRRDFLALRHTEPVLEAATGEGILLHGSYSADG